MDSVIMIFQQSDLNEEVHGSRGFSGWFPFPLIRPSGTFSLEGEGFASLFETVDTATSGKPCVQNDMGVG